MARTRVLGIGASIAILIGLASPASSHHAFVAEFDPDNCRDFEGIFTDLDWQSPHAFFNVDVVEEDGTVNNWTFQTYALITLRRAGNGREVFMQNIGKEVWVRGCLARSGREHYAAAGTLRFASDGILRQMGQIQN
ncbi:MAG: DUF6152 family protein [Gammaproteobacteria bacterium]|nr:DUF6152 family protein [Gammaproteobacteria bacterium]